MISVRIPSGALSRIASTSALLRIERAAVIERRG
jgi:hypothetical protein